MIARLIKPLINSKKDIILKPSGLELICCDTKESNERLLQIEVVKAAFVYSKYITLRNENTKTFKETMTQKPKRKQFND